MSLSMSRSGLLDKFASIFKPKDPIKRSILESVILLDRMIKNIEASKRNLELVLEEHKKKAKISGGGDRELINIIDEESRNISGYLALFSKVSQDLVRVRYRLETLAYVQEPLKSLPEILEELKRIEPEVEKINPQLLMGMRMLEQRIGSIMASTSSETFSLFKAKREETAAEQSQAAQAKAPSLVQRVIPPEPPAAPPIAAQAKPEEPQPVKQAEARPAAPQPPEKEVPLNVVEQWILRELQMKGGILDISSFTSRYKISKEKVLEALASLERQGLIKLKRK